MVVAISGSTGFIGSKLTEYLKSRGMDIVSINRADFNCDTLFNKIDRCDCVINLAGESIFKRWTNSYKKRIVSSRIETTKQIVDCINRSKHQKIFISASAIGYYASHGSSHETYDEYKYTKGSDFLAEVCSKWEAEALRCDGAHRTIVTRFAVVLDKDGGALNRVLSSMKLGIATSIGGGKQAFSWIALDDLVKAIEYLIIDTKCSGIYNISAPQPTTNLEFTKHIASKMDISLTLPLPKFIFKIAMGESSTLLINGQNVLPTRLIQNGFKFKYKTIREYISSL